jgi:amino acid transporter
MMAAGLDFPVVAFPRVIFSTESCLVVGDLDNARKRRPRNAQGDRPMDPDRKPQQTAEPTLTRSMSPFSSFAIAMSTICILAGGVTSFHVGLNSVGGAAIGVGWPLEWLFALVVAMTMAQAASAFPTAGGTYHWSYTLGGRGWGWATACFSLAGLVTAMAAVNVGLCYFVIGAASRIGHYNPEEVYPWVQIGALLVMTFIQALVNHRGIRLTSRLNDFAGSTISPAT